MKFIVRINESSVERDVGSNKNIKAVLNDFIPINMPFELVEMIRKWKVVTKSPYSDSFYDITNKSWEDDFDQSFFRVADHWNFSTARSFDIHCRTDKAVPKNVWTIAKFDPKTGLYKVIKNFDFLVGLEQNHHSSDGYEEDKAERIRYHLKKNGPMTHSQLTKYIGGDIRRELVWLLRNKMIKQTVKLGGNLLSAT